MMRKPALGLVRMCFFDMPSVNWPKHICAGPQAISEESSVTCGSPSGVTVASRPIFNSGRVLWMSSSKKVVRGVFMLNS